MYRSSAKRLSAFLVSVGFVLGSATALFAAQSVSQTPKITHSVKHAKSAPLRDYKIEGPVIPRPPREVKNKNLPPKASAAGAKDTAVQDSPNGSSPPTELLQFDGNNDDDNQDVVGFRIVPPDTEGEVGPNHYFQWNNLVLTIYDKQGNLVLGPLPGNAPWAGFGDTCETSNDGDPVVMYDQLAGRWFITQFAFPNFPSPPYIQCVAVSLTSDPTGEYYQYQFNLPDTYLNDYPKFGVWPDAYYMTFNGFDVFGGGFQGGAWAMDRTAMLAGDPATMIGFNTGEEGGVLPSDLDGLNPPPPGTPNYFLTFEVNPSRLLMWAFHADFATPANSTFTALPDLTVDDFVTPVCGSFRDQCVPQLDSGELLETLSHATMWRMAYRNFGDYESLTTNHTVGVTPAAGEGSGVFAGIRWYELRTNEPTVGEGIPNPWAVHQQSTFAPDSNWRWMGSIAQDANGNMALGYSISSASMYPSIGITGRLAGDPINTMAPENIFLEGGGSQVDSFSRWGDYSSMTVDPVDDCTFWYTTEYYQDTADFDYKTRIASFKYPGCIAPGTGTLEGTVTDGTNPIQGATVLAGGFGTTTNAAGFYQFNVPVGFYDMTASKYGYLPGSANDVEVTEGGTTTQDFTLDVAPTALVNGTVRDAAGNWPLYAKIQISGPGYPGATLWTNPVTGYYSVTLVEGITYNFIITAFSSGYETGGGPLNLGVPLGNAPAIVQNWTLQADALACTAPGYTPDIHGLYEDFTSGSFPPDWTIVNNSGDGGQPWSVFSGSDPCGLFGGNQTGGSGPYALINSNCDGQVTDDTDMITASADLSSVGSPVLRFASDFEVLNPDFPQTGEVAYSTNGGTTWTNVLTLTTNSPGPLTVEIPLGGAANQADVQARFHFNGFWAWWWQVDNVLLGEANCVAGTGGLIVGNVYDAATNAGIDGAAVTNLTGGGSTTTVSTPDPAVDEGFYILYGDAGPADLEATKDLYQPDQASTVVVPGSTVQVNFSLLSGNLSVTPTALNGRTNPGGTDQEDVTVTNTGAAPASFEFVEINAPLLTNKTHGFVSPNLRNQAVARLPQGGKGAEHWARTAQGLAKLPGMPRPIGRRLAAGDVISQFNTDLSYAWGVAATGSTIWIDTFALGTGDFNDHEYTPDGTQTGNTIDLTGVGLWAADGTYNPLTGKTWRVAVGGDNCLYELDPVSHTQTGNTICGSPWTGISQRGLAFDQAGNTFFVGGWNEGVVYHVDLDGNTIDSAFVNLPISGLAYSSANGHLLVMSNTDQADVTVLDALNNYDVVGSFDITDGGSDVLGPFEQAGMDFDCIGNLWVTNQATNVAYQVVSGEAAGCEVDIPWFSVNPSEGTVGPAALRQGGGGNTFPVSADWDAGTLLPGLQMAQLVVKTDTPHSIPNIPVTLTVRFLDVPDGNQFDDYIYAAAGAGVMFGGPPPCPQGILYFCPDGVVTRADMAGYLWRAIFGRNTPPPVYQNVFADVTFNDYNSFYIQGIYDMGITAGCLDGTVYCPDDPNTRQQMSVFIWKGEHGDEAPPACSGVFDDVPCPSQFADYIEALYNEGVTAGCGGNNFCPTANITNGQMSVFLVKGFNIPVVVFP